VYSPRLDRDTVAWGYFGHYHFGSGKAPANVSDESQSIPRSRNKDPGMDMTGSEMPAGWDAANVAPEHEAIVEKKWKLASHSVRRRRSRNQKRFRIPLAMEAAIELQRQNKVNAIRRKRGKQLTAVFCRSTHDRHGGRSRM
jgi:hypothetical protein